MPDTVVYLYAEDGRCPVLEWLRELDRTDPRAVNACIARIRLLRAFGHELRRPHADMLRDGISELRVRSGHVNYQLLYFFHGRDIAIVAHGLTKEREVPKVDIERAIERRKRYEQQPEEHRASFDQ